MRLVAIQLALLAVALLATSAHSTSIAIPVPPEKKLDDFRVARDVSSLINYLEFGVPPDHVPLVHGSPKQATLVFNRFNYYTHTVDALSKLGDPRAVLVLKRIQAGRLPPVLQADLDMALASIDNMTSWEHWKFYEDVCRERLALRATVAIELISGESQAEFLRSMLKEYNGRLMKPRDNQYLDRSLFSLQAEIAEEALKSGSTAGVDSMISLLRSADAYVREAAARKLREWTDQPIGPYEDSPETTLWRDVRQWEMWWAISRNSVNPVSLLPEPNKIRRLPPGKTLRDKLRNSVLVEREHWYWSDNGDREWVYVHAQENLDALRKIALDPHERHEIRAAALRILVSEDRKNAFDVAVSCLRDNSAGHRLYSTAASVIRGYPKRSAEVLTNCIAETWPGASATISMVAQDGVLRPLLEELLPELTGGERDWALLLLVEPKDLSMPAVELALAHDDERIARSALRTVEKLSLEASLSSEARRHMERWKNNPEFEYWNLPWITSPEDKKATYLKVMESKDPSDPRAASFFALAMREVGGQEASDGFVRCVEYYRNLEGRGWTLADLGYK